MTTQREAQFKLKFTNHLDNFGRQQADIGYKRNELINIRRLDSLARIFNGQNSQNCTAVCFYRGKLYVASNEDIFEHIKAWLQQIKRYINSGSIPNKGKAGKRHNKDLRKVIASLTGIGRRKVYKGTAGGNTSKSSYIYKAVHLMPDLASVFTDIVANIILIPNTIGLHAELCVMNYLINNGLYQPLSGADILFGISKLCCKLCACGMNAVGLSARVHYRAIHGNFYNKWLLPIFISANHEVLKKFLGQEAYTIYEEHKAIRPVLLAMIPTGLGIASGRGASSSALSASEAEESAD
jgi:hypothetical protein